MVFGVVRNRLFLLIFLCLSPWHSEILFVLADWVQDNFCPCLRAAAIAETEFGAIFAAHELLVKLYLELQIKKSR